MFRWLLGSILAGAPSGLDPLRLDDLTRDVGRATPDLALGLDATVRHLTEAPTDRLAEEAMSLLAPLAERVGLDTHRALLEDAAFRVLDPSRHAALSARLPADEPGVLADLEGAARETLIALGLDGRVGGRVKSLYSTDRKMQRKGVDLDAIADRVAVRVRVAEIADTYRVLEAMHGRFTPIEAEFDDYIQTPRPSGYRSLHTALQIPRPDGRIAVAELQIRTHAMHAEAEEGPAAHWRYKQSA